MELRQLEAFVALAEGLHFRKTAQRLGVPQPYLSRLIRRLEAGLGTPLFHRTQRRVELSEGGRALLPEARKLLAQAGAVLEATRRTVRGPGDVLHVGFALPTAYSVFPAYVRSFTRRHPEVALSFSEGSTVEQEKALLDGRLNVGFLYPPLYSPDLEHRVLGREELRVALPADHPAASAPRLELADLADSPWIFLPRWDGPLMYDTTLALCKAAGFRPRIVQEVGLAQVGVALVAAGVGIYLTFASLEAIRVPGVVFRPLQGAPRLEVALAWRTDNRSAVLRQFLQTAEGFSPPQHGESPHTLDE